MDYRSTTITVNDSEVTTSRNWQQLNHIKQTQFVRKNVSSSQYKTLQSKMMMANRLDGTLASVNYQFSYMYCP